MPCSTARTPTTPCPAWGPTSADGWGYGPLIVRRVRAGEAHVEGAALAGCRVGPDVSPVALGDEATEGEAQAEAAETLGVRGAAAVERLEDLAQQFGRDAGAVVLNHEHDRVVLGPHSGVDRAVVG